MARPTVDVVVPFKGDRAVLQNLIDRLTKLRLGDGDTLVVVDNTPGAEPLAEGRASVPVLRATERATPGYARNRGAARGAAEWIVFIDADTDPAKDLLDRYFDPSPAPATALLAGGIADEEAPAGAPAAQRYAYLWGMLSHDRTLAIGPWSFPQSANLACRRTAFEAVGGFREDIRAAEDADLSYRLRAAGWELERREAARVLHRSRATVSGLITQRAVHGAGGAWLNREYPDSFPGKRRPGLVWWAVRFSARCVISSAIHRDRDELVLGLLTCAWELAYEFGRSLPNERPARAHRRTPAGQ